MAASDGCIKMVACDMNGHGIGAVAKGLLTQFFKM